MVHHDAEPGVEYGCGKADCTKCYEPMDNQRVA